MWPASFTPSSSTNSLVFATRTGSQTPAGRSHQTLHYNSLIFALPLTPPPLSCQRHPPSRGETKGLAHVIIKYHVKPSAHKAFLEAWNKAEEATGA